MAKSPTSGSLRKLINSILLIDSEFDAFCQDFFPETFRLFSAAMDRVKKVSLLLITANRAQIMHRLQTEYVDKFNSFSHLLITDSDDEILGTAYVARIKNAKEAPQGMPKHEELIGILKLRASNIIEYLAHYRPAYTKRFAELHNAHIESIEEGRLIQAHEILRQIHEFLARLDDTKADAHTSFIQNRFKTTKSAKLDTETTSKADSQSNDQEELPKLPRQRPRNPSNPPNPPHLIYGEGEISEKNKEPSVMPMLLGKEPGKLGT